jgi:hypothetical protein
MKIMWASTRNGQLEDKEGDGRITSSLILVTNVAVMGDKWGFFRLTSLAVSGRSEKCSC